MEIEDRKEVLRKIEEKTRQELRKLEEVTQFSQEQKQLG